MIFGSPRVVLPLNFMSEVQHEQKMSVFLGFHFFSSKMSKSIKRNQDLKIFVSDGLTDPKRKKLISHLERAQKTILGPRNSSKTKFGTSQQLKKLFSDLANNFCTCRPGLTHEFSFAKKHANQPELSKKTILTLQNKNPHVRMRTPQPNERALSSGQGK